MKKSLLLILMLISSVASHGQYDAALGLKANHYKIAVNYKFFLSDSSSNALDLELGFQEYGVEFIGMYNWQVPINQLKGLYWYYGVGFNSGVWDGPVRDINIGADLQVGVEFVSSQIPIAFSLDYTPNFSLKHSYSKEFESGSWGSGFWFENWTFGVKYFFGKYE